MKRTITRGRHEQMVKARKIFLVSCSKRKRSSPAPAKDLYAGSLFEKAREHVEGTGAPWYILSAKFGLLHPERVIEPYDETLARMPVAHRQAWAARVCAALREEIGQADEIVIFAGRKYYEFLVPCLEVFVGRVLLPLKGLSQGRQLAWFNEQAALRKG